MQVRNRRAVGARPCRVRGINRGAGDVGFAVQWALADCGPADGGAPAGPPQGNLDRRAGAGYEAAMRQRPPGNDGRGRPSGDGEDARAARLKAALRANLGRRKAQARSRQPVVETGDAEATGPDEQS